MAKIEDFAKLEFRVGRILMVEDVEKARKPIYKFLVDMGPEIGMRIILAGIKSHYSKEQLLNKEVICITNLEPKTIAGVESNGMVLAAEDENGIALLTPDKELKEGSAVR